MSALESTKSLLEISRESLIELSSLSEAPPKPIPKVTPKPKTPVSPTKKPGTAGRIGPKTLPTKKSDGDSGILGDKVKKGVGWLRGHSERLIGKDNTAKIGSKVKKIGAEALRGAKDAARDEFSTRSKELGSGIVRRIFGKKKEESS